ncbi:MAG: dipeptide ABC transporter ATP-binding protein [Methylococcales bacterium]|nr:dipeptide ABC transporter ATP-binding protein [Methylococcales bacterium]MDD5753725.1 dipeptide ABC transporter ATP-binding protein [Methylococcales bacterium]
MSLFAIENLSIRFGDTLVVDNISFEIHAGETFALVGESGSGKSMTALAALNLLPYNANVQSDLMRLQSENLSQLSEKNWCKIRGRRLSIIFQDPIASLNPVMTIGQQIAEVLTLHFELSKIELKQRVVELLQQVELPNAVQRVKDYPHQLSGGQRQRVMIALALAGKPDLLIADEPTTALDVTIQAQILELLKNIQAQTGMALWLISHDLALVANIAQRVAVMQNGKIVETGDAKNLFQNPQHPYSQKLVAALPSMRSCENKEITVKPALLTVQNFHCHYPIRKGILKRVVDYVRAVDGVSFSLQQGKTLALVGESGCGKTTLGKALLHLIPSSSGEVFLDGIALHSLTGEVLRQQRAAIQIVFQDPFSSMNPRMLVGEIIAEGLRALHSKMSATERETRVRNLLLRVELPEEAMYRYPHEFSGGQRQRICIARALAVEPKVIICDEPTSALDVSVQAQIIQLLKTLQKEQGMSYLFITHDLGVVAEIADDVLVMYKGKIVEQGAVAQVLMQPQHPYTQKLLAAVPKF